jgi:hypothetical protein
MKLITTRYRAWKHTRQDLTGYTVIKRQHRLFGWLLIWSVEIDREDIPSWAFIQRACLGSTDWVNPIWARHPDKEIG